MSPEAAEQGAEVAIAQNDGVDYLAKVAHFTGRALSKIRPACGTIIGQEIIRNPEYHSMQLAGETAAVGAGDKGDGTLIRFAAKREGRETTVEGAREDERNDKEWAKRMMRAFIGRAILDKKYGRALFFLVNAAVIDTRDAIATNDRDEAQEFEVDIKPSVWSKLKTGFQNTVFAYETSPPARTDTGRKVGYAGQLFVTGLSVMTGISKHRKLKREIDLAKSKNS